MPVAHRRIVLTQLGVALCRKAKEIFFFLDASNYGDDSFMKNLDHLSLGLTEQNGFWVFNG